MRIYFLAILLTYIGVNAIAQNNEVFQLTLPWKDAQIERKFESGDIMKVSLGEKSKTVCHSIRQT